MDKNDLDRLSDLAGQKLNDVLIIGGQNASYNARDLVMEPDLPLPKGFLETMQDFQIYEEELEIEPILEQQATYPPLDRELSDDVLEMLPDLMGALIMVTAQLMTVIDPEAENPTPELWDRTAEALDLIL